MTRCSSGWLGLPVLFFATSVCLAWDAASSTARLNLKNEDVYEGQILDSDQANVIRWQSPIANAPLEFPVATVRAIYRNRAENEMPGIDDTCLELAGGDVLFGELKSLTSDSALVESRPLGDVEVPLSQISRVFLGRKAGGLNYFGPNGLAGWQTKEDEGKWRDENGHLVAEGKSQLERKLLCSPQTCLELTLDVKEESRFSVAFGDLFQLETIEQNIVLIRANRKEAAIALVSRLEKSKLPVRLRIYVDQSLGTVHVFSIEGRQLAKVELKGDKPTSEATFSLTNHKGPLKLEQLIVRGWNGMLPSSLAKDAVILYLADGANRKINSLTIDAKQVTVNSGDQSDERVDRDEVLGVAFRNASSGIDSPLRVTLRDGTRLSGELQNIQDGKLLLTSPRSTIPLNISVSEVDSLVGQAEHTPKSTSNQAHCLLVSDEVQSRGLLVNSPEGAPAGSLFWKPFESPTTVQLRPDISAKIDVSWPENPRELSAKEKAAAGAQLARLIQQGGKLFQRATGSRVSQAEPAINVSVLEESIVLKGGDRITCEVESIDEKYVRFKSDLVEVTSLPQSVIKAWQHSTTTKLDKLQEDKRTRLMTLPRLQRNSPPTHMIESVNGDFLRGRLIEMNNEFLVVEVRLENKKIARNLIHRIVWLDSQTEEVEQKVPEKQVQVANHDGIRVTFSPTKLIDGVLEGNSELLGPCHVHLSQVSQLLLGSAIGNLSSGKVADDQWALKDARDPLFVNADTSSSGGDRGVSSALVGNEAPDFKLDMLVGGKFQLSANRGKVIVLDFWASWCGPCVQAMPLIDEVVKEFDKDIVRLIGVNLQEDRETASSLLERLEITPEVALDIDGATAEKFQVSAIPQTVVIDRKGTVRAVFIGGGPELQENIRTAIQRALEPAE